MFKPLLTAGVIALTLFVLGFWAGTRSYDNHCFNRGFSYGVASVKRGSYDDGHDAAIREIASCTLAKARAEKCFIPCASDADCLEKNGTSDH